MNFAPPTNYTLTLDDDPMVSRFIEKALGIPSYAFFTIDRLLGSAEQLDPIAVFVDIHLESNICGLQIIPMLKQKWAFRPVLVITADPSDEAVTRALTSGADDFVAKPIRATELYARLHARLTDQAQKEVKNRIRFADFTIETAHRCLKGPSAERYLSPTEFNLLRSLIQASGTMVTRSELKVHCWGPISVSDNALDRKIYEVRRTLRDAGSRVVLEAVYGVGFLMAMPKGVGYGPSGFPRETKRKAVHEL